MSDVTTKSTAAAEKLIQNSEDELYEQLAIRAAAMADDPSLASSFDFVGVDPAKTAGIKEQLGKAVNVGKRIFDRWNLEAYKLICGSDSDDQAQRQELANSFGLGEAAIAGGIATLLIGSFGMAPLIATVVASIIVSRFMRGAYEEFCKAWKEDLPATT